MRNIKYSTHRCFAMFVGAALLGAQGCDLALSGAHLPLVEDDFEPVRRVLAVSQNAEFVFLASGDEGALRLISDDGELEDEFSLNEDWRPVGATTYRGPNFTVGGVDQGEEAALVLHANGVLLPWFHHRGRLRYHWSGRATAAWWPILGTVTYLDVDQAVDGAVYVLAQDVREDGTHHTMLAWDQPIPGPGEPHGGARSIASSEGKAVAVAYDQYRKTINVAFARSEVQHVKVVEYADHAGLEQGRRELTDVEAILDFEVLAGWHYLGVLACDNTLCSTSSTPQLQLRNSDLEIDTSITEAAGGVALDLPPFPPTADAEVHLWRTGRDAWQLSEYDVVVQ